jgi:hypothetical protein
MRVTVFEEKRPLVIDVPGGGRRNIAELFNLDEFIGVKGIIFVDVFYPEATWHPVHWIKGEISGEAPIWFLENAETGEDVTIEILDEKIDPDLADELRRWKEYLVSDPVGIKASRQSAEATLRQWAKAGSIS